MTPAPFFNACDYLLDRHIREGRGNRLAPRASPRTVPSAARLSEKDRKGAQSVVTKRAAATWNNKNSSEADNQSHLRDDAFSTSGVYIRNGAGVKSDERTK